MQTYKEDEWQRVQGKPARNQREAEVLAAPVEEVRQTKPKAAEVDENGIQIASSKKGGGKKKRVETVADPSMLREEVVPDAQEDDEAVPIQVRPNDKKSKKKEDDQKAAGAVQRNKP